MVPQKGCKHTGKDSEWVRSGGFGSQASLGGGENGVSNSMRLYLGGNHLGVAA